LEFAGLGVILLPLLYGIVAFILDPQILSGVYGRFRMAKGDLKRISNALSEYADQHDGELPGTLQEAVAGRLGEQYLEARPAKQFPPIVYLAQRGDRLSVAPDDRPIAHLSRVLYKGKTEVLLVIVGNGQIKQLRNTREPFEENEIKAYQQQYPQVELEDVSVPTSAMLLTILSYAFPVLWWGCFLFAIVGGIAYAWKVRKSPQVPMPANPVASGPHPSPGRVNIPGQPATGPRIEIDTPGPLPHQLPDAVLRRDIRLFLQYVGIGVGICAFGAILLWLAFGMREGDRAGGYLAKGMFTGAFWGFLFYFVRRLSRPE